MAEIPAAAPSMSVVPYKAQDDKEVAELVRELVKNRGKVAGPAKKNFTCKESMYRLSNEARTLVSSWKFNDWDYKRRDLPTYARGLFTYKEENHNRIAIRGYDKFFNINEVHQTEWAKIDIDTQGPYELSVKENGCIIFISGLSDGTLIVCSKHSTGVRDDVALSHSIVGEKWIDRQLKGLGQSRKDLADELFRRNVTAVAELCDDAFEEHILEYSEDKAGLYLHGINLNLPTFSTYPIALVDEFAERWGFRKTKFVILNTAKQVRAFLEECGETGSWEDRDIEGFVIRCRARDKPGSTWYDWFFKYKFEEPYLMYRNWREATKAMIRGKQPRIHKHKAITEQYLIYAKKQIHKDPKLAKDYMNNKGIIAMREGFLKELGLRGSDIIKQETEESSQEANSIILVPVATLGCGKTTVAVGLHKLFGWQVVQNDDITIKKNKAAHFAQQCSMALATCPVVIADRNNHQRRERQQLMDDISGAVPDAHFIALHYLHRRPNEKPTETLQSIRQVTRERILARGDNHQTIQTKNLSEQRIIGIMEGFLNRFEPVNPDQDPDSGFEMIISLDPLAESRDNIELIIERLNERFPKLFTSLPTGDELDAALSAALDDYQPSVFHQISSSSSKTTAREKSQARAGSEQPDRPLKERKITNAPAPIEYFGITVPYESIITILNEHFGATGEFIGPIPRARVQKAFHITVIHRSAKKTQAKMWEKYSAILRDHPGFTENQVAPKALVLEKTDVKLKSILYDDTVMSIDVELADDMPCANAVAHITIGTRDDSIKPKMSNDMLEAWIKTGSGTQIKLPDGLTVPGELRAQESRPW